MNDKNFENRLWYMWLMGIISRYANGYNISKYELDANIETRKKQDEDAIKSNKNLTDEQKRNLIKKLSIATDAVKEYIKEELRCQNRLIE